MLNHLEKAFWTIGDKMLADSKPFHSSEEFRTVTSELVIKPSVNRKEPQIETKQTLDALTKREICELAAERFGVELSMRDDKTTLIAQYLYEQG